MAAVRSGTWCKLMFLKRNQMLTQGVYRYYAIASSKRDDGVLQKVKRFVFGETVSPDQLEQSDPQSYYKLTEAKTPQLFSMHSSEIKDKLESITKNTISTDQNWLSVNTTDMILKFKILKSCIEEFGVEIPSHHLKDIRCVEDIVNYYCSLKKPDTKTFKSLDLENLPPNLQIGGKVPRKGN